MSNYLQDGAGILYQRMSQFAGQQISYKRKGAQPIVFVAVPGRVTTETSDVNGSILKETTRDFIVKRELLKDLDPPRPVRGDEIVDDAGEVFGVGGDNLGISPYEEADSYHVAWRIHTKRLQRNA